MTEIFFANFRNFESLLPNYFIESRQIEELIGNEVETIQKNDTDLCTTCHQNTIIVDRPSFSNFAENKFAELADSSPKFKFGQRSQLILLISTIMASILFLICSSLILCIKRRRRRQQRRQSVHFPLQKRPSDVSVVEVQLDSSAI